MTPTPYPDVQMADVAVDNPVLDKTISGTRPCGASTPNATFIEVSNDKGFFLPDTFRLNVSS